MPDPSDRLDSWKQIAAYLGKSERTVRRWQVTEGLPVHRHVHLQRGSVWAYQSELDEWAAMRRATLKPVPEAEVANPVRIGPLGFFAGMALGAIAIGLLVSPVKRFSANSLRTVPLTSLPGIEYGPAFSPDGRQIAFFWGPHEGRPGIYIKAVGSDTQKPLVTSNDGTFVYNPAWSPDGKTIAFLRRNGGATWLERIPASGGQPTRLTLLKDRGLLLANNMHLSWTADGQWILAPAVQRTDRQSIHRISAETGKIDSITDPSPAADMAPVLAGDGRSLAFVRERSGSRDPFSEILWMRVGRDGAPESAPQLLYQGRFLAAGMAWAPNSRDLVVCSNEFGGIGGTSLWRLGGRTGGVSGGVVAPLGIHDCTSVAVSHADSSGAAMLALGNSSSSPSTLWRASLTSLDRATSFAPSSRMDAEPSFSPDGGSVAFLSDRSGSLEIWVAMRDGSKVRRITEGANTRTIPAWSPDGRHLAYSRDGHLFVVPVAGGSPARIFTLGETASRPSWSRDGQHLYYCSAWRVWRMRTDSGSATALPNLLGHIPVLESPDGKALFYMRSGRPYALCRIPAGGGSEEILHDDLITSAFAVSKQYVYWMRNDRALYRQPVNGGPVQNLGFLRESPSAVPQRVQFGLAVAPDDSSVVYTVAGKQEIDILLVRNFR